MTEPDRVEALETLERIGYLDDGRFAAARAGQLADRGYGDEAIRLDLEQQGVAADDVSSAVGSLAPEQERALALVEQHGATRKTALLLARRGFDPDAIEAAVGSDVAPDTG